MDSPTEIEPKNEALRWFVYEHCGGPTKASHALRVSATAIHQWLTAGRVLAREKAIEAARACSFEVSVAQLMALPESEAEISDSRESETTSKSA